MTQRSIPLQREGAQRRTVVAADDSSVSERMAKPPAESPLRIAYLVNQYPQPSQSFIRREIAALETRGVLVSRFTLRASSGALVDAEDRAERDRTRVVLDSGIRGVLVATARAFVATPGAFLAALGLALRIGRRSLRGPLVHLAYLGEACLLARWLRDEPVQHLHAHFGTNSATVAMLTRVLGGPPYSLTIHGPEEFDQPVGLGLREKVARAAFAVAISHYGRSQLLRWCAPEDWPKVEIVRCGVDDAYLREPPPPLSEAPGLLAIGRLSPEKGQLLLIEAAQQLTEEKLDFSLVIVGDGPLRESLERAIRERGLSERVRLAGWLDGPGVRDEIARSRALVAPSFSEGLSVVLMEALALHRPVVATAIAGTPELIEPGRNGWLVSAGSAQALAEAMRAVLLAPLEDLERMGAAGAALVAERHDAGREADRLLQCFRRGIR